MHSSTRRCARLKTRISLVRSSSIVEVTSSVLRQTTRFLRQVETLESTGIRIRSLAQSARQVHKVMSDQLDLKVTSVLQVLKVTSVLQVRRVTLVRQVHSDQLDRKAILAQQDRRVNKV